MDTDKTWKRFGDLDPYFGVLTLPQYESHRLTDQARDEFFQSGEEHVLNVLKTLREINPGFCPRRTLDFGCGVGRVTLPLARTSASVLGVDIAPGMLLEARQNARERGLGNVTFAHTVDGYFDLIHSFIVLQHISPRRGMRIISDLVSRVEPGGMIALQVPYHRDAPAWRRLATPVKRKVPLINGVVNLFQGRRFNYPAMTMFCYDVSEILSIFRRTGIYDIRITLESTDTFGYANVMFYGKNSQV